VKVGVLAETGVTIEGGEEYDDGVLHLVEGDSIDVLCYARHGCPAAYLAWSGPENINGTEDLVISQVRIESAPSYPVLTFSMIQAISVTTVDHTISISRTAHYTAS
jgi:hypothetical protein